MVEDCVDNLLSKTIVFVTDVNSYNAIPIVTSKHK